MFKILCSFLFLLEAAYADNIGLSVRALGMGNAHTAIVNNGDAVFYNPAGLAKMNGFNWTILDWGLGTNAYESYQDFLDIAENSNDVSEIMNDLYGTNVNIYTGGKTLFSIGGLSFGAYGVGDANFTVNNPAFPNIDANYRLDYGLLVGWGMELIPKYFNIGTQVRRVTRQGGKISVGASTIATLNSTAIQDEFNRKGDGYAFDWGATLSFPGALKPTVAFTWRDMGNTKYYANAGTPAPKITKQEHVLGLGLSYETVLMSIKPALDFRFLNNSDIQIGKRLSLGVELGFPILDIRAGLNQGYYTLGTSFDLWILRVDAATYGVELGEYPGQLEDRRYMVQISFDFGFDPGNFSFFKRGRPRSAKKHHRKLRR